MISNMHDEPLRRTLCAVSECHQCIGSCWGSTRVNKDIGVVPRTARSVRPMSRDPPHVGALIPWACRKAAGTSCSERSQQAMVAVAVDMRKLDCRMPR